MERGREGDTFIFFNSAKTNIVLTWFDNIKRWGYATSVLWLGLTIYSLMRKKLR